MLGLQPIIGCGQIVYILKTHGTGDQTMNGANLRPVTVDLVKAIYLACWPGMAARCDFGLDGLGGTNPQEVYEAYYYPLREGEITDKQLDAALGDGPALTKLVRGCKHNPHKDVVIKTAYDNMSSD